MQQTRQLQPRRQAPPSRTSLPCSSARPTTLSQARGSRVAEWRLSGRRYPRCQRSARAPVCVRWPASRDRDLPADAG
eukprot:9645286-Alexandrium_andersonii.AAC.2